MIVERIPKYLLKKNFYQRGDIRELLMQTISPPREMSSDQFELVLKNIQIRND
jgi:hypothetical protein